MNNEKQTQVTEFNRALLSGHLRELVASRGGTGDLRKPFTSAEKAKRKARRKQAKASRQFNRKGA
jgi:hypothetical protein